MTLKGSLIDKREEIPNKFQFFLLVIIKKEGFDFLVVISII